MANAVTPTSWFYSLYIHTTSNQNQRDCPSRLEISFLLDSGASYSVLNHPTYLSIAKLLNIKQNNRLNPSKTLTVANQTEVLILHYVTLSLNTTIEDDSRQFTIPFALAIQNTKYLVHPSLKNLFKKQTYKTLLNNSNINRPYTQIILKLHHSYPNTTHISHISTESILKHKYV